MAPNNYLGEIIKVLMITSAGSEGINLRNTRYVHIMEPYWHPVRVEQVIGRARRICSHQALPKDMQNVQVFVYVATLTTEPFDNSKECLLSTLTFEIMSHSGILANICFTFLTMLLAVLYLVAITSTFLSR